jgi:hypothetical protein
VVRAEQFVALVGLYVEAEHCTGDHREGVVEAVADVGRSVLISFTDGRTALITEREDWTLGIFRRAPGLIVIGPAADAE